MIYQLKPWRRFRAWQRPAGDINSWVKIPAWVQKAIGGLLPGDWLKEGDWLVESLEDPEQRGGCFRCSNEEFKRDFQPVTE